MYKKIIVLVVSTIFLNSCWGPTVAPIPCDLVAEQLEYQFVNLCLPEVPLVNDNFGSANDYAYRSINLSSSFVAFTKRGSIEIVKSKMKIQEKIEVVFNNETFSTWKESTKSSYPINVISKDKKELIESSNTLSTEQLIKGVNTFVKANSRQLIFNFAGDAKSFENFVFSIEGPASFDNREKRQKIIGYTEMGSKIMVHYLKMKSGKETVPVSLEVEKNTFRIKDISQLKGEVTLEMRITYDAFNHDYEAHKTRDRTYVAADISNLNGETNKNDIALLRMDGEGKKINQLTIIRANGDEKINSITVNPDNEVYLCGYTNSKDFPIGAKEGTTEQRSYLLRINEKDEIISGTYLSGDNIRAEDIIFDKNRNYWVTGRSSIKVVEGLTEPTFNYTTNFPFVESDSIKPKRQNYFVAKLDKDLKVIEVSNFEETLVNDCIAFLPVPCDSLLTIGPSVYGSANNSATTNYTVTTEMRWRTPLDAATSDWSGAVLLDWTWGRHAMAWMHENYTAPVPFTSQNPPPNPVPGGFTNFGQNTNSILNLPNDQVTIGEAAVLTAEQNNLFTGPNPWSTWEANVINSTGVNDRVSEMLLGVGFYHERWGSPVYMDMDGRLLASNPFPVQIAGVLKRVRFTVVSSSAIGTFQDICPSLFTSNSLGDNFDIPCLNNLNNQPIFISADAGWWHDTFVGSAPWWWPVCGGDPVSINNSNDLALLRLGSIYIADPPKDQEIEIDIIAEYSSQMAVRMAVVVPIRIREMRADKVMREKIGEGPVALRSAIME